MRSKKQGWLALCLLVVLFVTGCREKGAQLQSSATLPDKELYKNGEEWMEKGQYLKARLAFQTLINTYPDSELTPKSFFNIAESFYEEGGKEGLLQAEAQLKDFMVFYPTHEKTAEAQLKIAALNMKMIEAPDRDPTYARRAETELKNFMVKFPNHDLRPEIESNLKKVQDVLAAGEYGKGQFYHKHRNYKASLSRYQDIVKNYPKYSEMDTVLVEMAEALIELKRPEEAVPVLTKVAAGWDSPKAEAAKRMLEDLEKPVPAVDPGLIAANEANRKPKEPLIKSPKEVMSLATGIFKGPKDPVKEMREQQEIRLAAGQAGKPPVAVADTTPPADKTNPDIKVTIPVQPGGAPSRAPSVPANPGSGPSGANGNPPPSGPSVTPASPAGGPGGALNAAPANSPRDIGEKEEPNTPKKKRGLFKRILRTGN